MPGQLGGTEEPGEGAHTAHAETARRLRAVILEQLDALTALSLDDLVEARYRRFRGLGAFRGVAAAPPPSITSRRERLRGRHGTSVSTVFPAARSSVLMGNLGMT